ncbi:MAG: kinase/pyrophosphorylase [Cohaesibacter sp.]|nr:kinase/pyrophosphorylase [Cohaesibacter sp.]MCV6601241.1 kinase/pyrophosphorylase [Cohaesibacter sp.]
MRGHFFHLHLVSDATGETLIAVARAAASQYSNSQPIEHVHPLIRNERQLDKILNRLEDEPGIVLYTLVNLDLAERLERHCQQLHIPVCNILNPVFNIFQSYLGASEQGLAGAQHSLDSGYFKRIDAMNFTMSHDDGQSPQSVGEADIVIVGISRTSKTPTSIYLANRGLRVANIPLVPDIPLPTPLHTYTKPMVIGLIASPSRIMQIRQNRILGFGNEGRESDYLNRNMIGEEIAYTRSMCQRNQWPILDVTRKSIEETAAEIYKYYQRHRKKMAAKSANDLQ